MITLKEWMEIVDYKITEGSDYGWNCYGHNAHTLDSWNGEHDGYSFCIIFDTADQTVFEVQAHDFANQRAYRIINSDYAKKHKKESKHRGELGNQAWDDVDYTDLEVEDDFIQKCLSIKAGEDYDTRVSVPIDLPDDMIFEMMKMAHDRDITLNQFVEEVLKLAIAQAESGELDEEDIL